MTEYEKKITEIVNILNDHEYDIRFRMGDIELYFYNDKKPGYIILYILTDNLVFIEVIDGNSIIKNTINNISDNKEKLLEELNLL